MLCHHGHIKLAILEPVGDQQSKKAKFPVAKHISLIQTFVFFTIFPTGPYKYASCILDEVEYKHEEEFTLDKCTECVCDNGQTNCVTIDCPPPPDDSCVIADESGCCPTYDCKKGKNFELLFFF